MEAIKPTLVGALQAGAPRPHDDGAVPAHLARGARRDHAPQARRGRRPPAQEPARRGHVLGRAWSSTSPTSAPQVDTGARNIDHILRASLLPQMSVAILERIAEGAPAEEARRSGSTSENNFTAVFPE